VWAGRPHLRELRTPREVRNALVYVRHNLKKTVRGVETLDACAPGFWFDNWREPRPRWALTRVKKICDLAHAPVEAMVRILLECEAGAICCWRVSG
jgi:hypothetical protein